MSKKNISKQIWQLCVQSGVVTCYRQPVGRRKFHLIVQDEQQFCLTEGRGQTLEEAVDDLLIGVNDKILEIIDLAVAASEFRQCTVTRP